MSKKQQQEIIEANDTLQTQIDASISAARSLVESWLPPPKPGEKIEDTEDDKKTMQEYSTGRPERLGLGAKFLSHKEATRHQGGGGGNSKQEVQLRNKILNQNQRKRKDDSGRKRERPQDDEDDDNEEDSRTSVVQSSNKKDTRKPANTDFLSAYMTERANKKSKKKKNKNKNKQPNNITES